MTKNGESAVKTKVLFRGNLLGIFSWFFVLLFYVNGASNFAPG